MPIANTREYQNLKVKLICYYHINMIISLPGAITTIFLYSVIN